LLHDLEVVIQALLRDHSRGDRVLSIGSWSSLKKLKDSLEAVLQLLLPSGYGRRIVDQALDTEDDEEDLYFDESFMSEVVPLLEHIAQFRDYNDAIDGCLLDMMLYFDDNMFL
jgi:hypothetical protein